MEKKGNDSLREELRSSQVYNVLKGSGIPVAGKIADGLDKATQGLGQVVDGFASGVRSGTSGNPGGTLIRSPPDRGITAGRPSKGRPKTGGPSGILLPTGPIIRRRGTLRSITRAKQGTAIITTAM